MQLTLTYAKKILKKRVSVEDLAGVAFLSPRQFTRLFKEETGETPAKAIERLRVESARLMMEAGRFSIEEIAQKRLWKSRSHASFIRSGIRTAIPASPARGSENVARSM